MVVSGVPAEQTPSSCSSSLRQKSRGKGPPVGLTKMWRWEVLTKIASLFADNLLEISSEPATPFGGVSTHPPKPK